MPALPSGVRIAWACISPHAATHTRWATAIPSRRSDTSLKQAGRRKIAFLCTRERPAADWISPQLRKAFGGVLIANEKFTKETAEATLEAGAADAVAFGQLFIANPDLPARFKLDAPLNTPDPSTFYAQGPKGYTDYPALAREIVGA